MAWAEISPIFTNFLKKPVTIYSDNREIIALNEHKNWSFKIRTVGQFMMVSKFILDCKYEIWTEKSLSYLLRPELWPNPYF